MKVVNVTKRMYETNAKFELNNAKATSVSMNGSDEGGKEYTITRTSMTGSDMGNQLYFCLDKGSVNQFFGLTIKHF